MLINNTAIIKFSSEFAKELTYSYTSKGHTTEIQVYKSPKEGLMVVPKSYAIRKKIQFRNISDNAKLGGEINVKFDRSGAKFNGNQLGLFKDVLNKLKIDGHALYVKGTGMGKSADSIFLASLLHRKTLIVISSSNILKQWVDEIVKWTDTKKSEIGIFYGKKKTVGKFTVGLVGSILNKIDIDPCFFKQFNTIIYDEIHTYCSPKRCQIFYVLSGLFNIGLTATPEKLNGFEKIMYAHFGNIINAGSIQIPWNINVNIVNYRSSKYLIKFNDPNDHKLGVSFWGIVKTMSRDKIRNKLIIDNTLKLYNSGECILLFTILKEHTTHLYDLLIKVLPKNQVLNLQGGVKNDGASNKNIRIIVTTYSFSGTGFSVKKMTSLVFGLPRKTGLKQIIGRITRLGFEHEKIRNIIDIFDSNSALSGQLKERKKEYVNTKAKIIYT